MSTASITEPTRKTNAVTDRLTEALEQKLSRPATSPDFDLHQGVNDVLADIGMTTADSGGTLTFSGSDPILPSPIRFGTMATIGLAARSVALAALWKEASGEGQDISLDVGKALRRIQKLPKMISWRAIWPSNRPGRKIEWYGMSYPG